MTRRTSADLDSGVNTPTWGPARPAGAWGVTTAPAVGVRSRAGRVERRAGVSLAPAASRITYGGGQGGGSMWQGNGCGCAADLGKRAKMISAMGLLFSRMMIRKTRTSRQALDILLSPSR
jgi:hypothetical protein